MSRAAWRSLHADCTKKRRPPPPPRPSRRFGSQRLHDLAPDCLQKRLVAASSLRRNADDPLKLDEVGGLRGFGHRDKRLQVGPGLAIWIDTSEMRALSALIARRAAFSWAAWWRSTRVSRSSSSSARAAFSAGA